MRKTHAETGCVNAPLVKKISFVYLHNRLYERSCWLRRKLGLQKWVYRVEEKFKILKYDNLEKMKVTFKII